MTAFEERFRTYQEAVETYLNGLYTGTPVWAELYGSARYSLLAGGKRIRPVLALEFARLSGLEDWKMALPAACGIEMIHTSSLIHDDLPCMDDDDLRRGRPTNHKVYGECLATLTGDTLLLDAFRLMLSSQDIPKSRLAECAYILAKAAGADGMVGGQVADTLHTNTTEEELLIVHRYKTGAMIAGACEIGSAAAGADKDIRDAASEYGFNLGLAFQIRDDVLDVVSSSEELGKPQGSDKDQGKVTFTDLFGLEECRQKVITYTDRAVESVAFMDRDDFLKDLAYSLIERRS